jgi:hypothetical protein
MTDVSKLMPGAELDAMVAVECFGAIEVDTTDNLPTYKAKYIVVKNGGLWVLKDRVWWMPSRDPTANADVERWLVDTAQRIRPLNAGDPPELTFVRVSFAPRWEVFYYCYSTDQHLLGEEADDNETNNGPIAARMLAVCRLAVRVAEELKKMEGKR